MTQEKTSQRFINLTPHTICLISEDETLEIKPSGSVARVTMREISIGFIDGWPMIAREPKAIENLPEPDPKGAIFVVSSMVLDMMIRMNDERLDVVAPDTGVTAKRDANGQIIGVTRLVGIL